jgi:hypothetical protein
MIRQNIWTYIEVGTCLRYLQDVDEGHYLKRKDEPTYILDNIKHTLDCLDKFGLPVTKRASTELQEFYYKHRNCKFDTQITAEQASELKNIVTTLRHTFVAEAQGIFAYIVTDKRIDVDKLLDDVSALFSPRILKLMPDIAQYDFMEAGKCIAYELSTAAAFHILRGTESTLRFYYCNHIKRGRLTTLLWRPMVEHLRKCKKPIPKILLDNLDNIAVNFRNPTAHPEYKYDINEVQDLFNLCVDVNNRMIGELIKHKLISPQQT